MKKIIFVLFCFFSFLIFASANEFKNMTIDIYIDQNGNAHVEEVWEAISNKDTEYYKSLYNLGNSEVSNFKVKDQSNNYLLETDWDINASFNKKAYKYGYNYTDEGVELCWGISNYGENTYYLSYDLSNIIVNTSDNYQVLYWNLIQKSSIPIDKYDITIRTDEDLPDSLDVWGFGAYKDLAYVADGVIKFVGEDQLKESEYVVGLVKFPGNTFNNTNQDSRSFDDFLKLAQKGAKAYKENPIIKLLGKLVSFIPYLIFIAISIFGVKNSGNKKYFNRLKISDDIKKLPKDYPMFRDIPCNKNIFIAYYIAEAYKISKKDSNIIGCVILKWVSDGLIKIEKLDKEQIMHLDDPSALDKYNGTDHEKTLYRYMYEASKDGSLSIDDFKKYCKKNYSNIINWTNNNYATGKSETINAGYITKDDVKGNSYTVNRSFYEEGLKIAGLRKFLIEFSDMKNKETIEVMLWKEYLIFAQMYGIAEKVAKQFKDLYPEVYEQSDFDYTTFIFINSFSNSGYSAASSARAAASSYSGGGGGFSSGGGGGGSFGGGGSIGSR